MDQSIDLVPLVCMKCNTRIPAEINEVAWVCEQCGQGLLLDQIKGLVPQEVNYASEIVPNTKGKPYWVAEGHVSDLKRETYDQQSGEAEQFWSQPHRFFIPAYTSTLEDLLRQATALLLQPPTLQPGPSVHFEPVTMPVEDVMAGAEFIVMAIEAGRKDKLKNVDFALQLSSPVLWILP